MMSEVLSYRLLTFPPVPFRSNHLIKVVSFRYLKYVYLWISDLDELGWRIDEKRVYMYKHNVPNTPLSPVQ